MLVSRGFVEFCLCDGREAVFEERARDDGADVLVPGDATLGVGANNQRSIGFVVDQLEAVVLVDRLVDPAELENEVQRFADVLAARSALTQRATKEIVAALTGGTDAEALAAPRYRETISAGELPEGVAAFAERRPPAFGWTG